MKRTQGGMTLIGFILALAVAGIFIYVGMKVIPMYSEYYAVKKSLDGLALEPGINNASPDRVRALFFRRLYVNYSDNVKPEHVKIERMQGGFQRTLRLPYPVDPSQVQARFDDGVLTVTLPKSGIKQGAQRIQVSRGTSQTGASASESGDTKPH